MDREVRGLSRGVSFCVENLNLGTRAMDQFSGVEKQNRRFKKMAWISLVVSACVLSVYVLQAMGVIPLNMF